jgi:hypothetical protein
MRMLLVIGYGLRSPSIPRKPVALTGAANAL